MKHGAVLPKAGRLPNAWARRPISLVPGRRCTQVLMPQIVRDNLGLLAEVKERVRSAQYAAMKSVNSELVGLYWDIGRMIVERQTDAECE
jgi:hypothetical protein